MKKVLMIIGGVVLAIAILFIVVFGVVSSTSEKLVCKSDKGNITIMYNKETITGYTAKGFSYNLEEQKAYAEQIGVDAYIEEFEQWFTTNTDGSCQ